MIGMATQRPALETNAVCSCFQRGQSLILCDDKIHGLRIGKTTHPPRAWKQMWSVGTSKNDGHPFCVTRKSRNELIWTRDGWQRARSSARWAISGNPTYDYKSRKSRQLRRFRFTESNPSKWSYVKRICFTINSQWVCVEEQNSWISNNSFSNSE